LYQFTKQGRFTHTPTLPPQGGGSFFNDFNQLIPSPLAGEGQGEGLPLFIELLPFIVIDKI